MDEINVYIVSLVAQNKLSHREAENFLDFAYDLCCDGVNDEEIESQVKVEIENYITEKN